jgi:O-antigen/teichoic acid export membrane protein
MGIIEKQSIKGTFWSYLGVVLGFITTGILLPRIMSTEENGLLKLLVAYSALFAQLGGLGFSRVTTMLFTYFRDKAKSHNGFLFISVMVALAGFILSLVILVILKNLILGQEESTLFTEYFFYVVPLIAVVLFFTVFDSYYKVLYNSVIGTVVKEFVQRSIILLGIVLYYYQVVEFRGFIILYIMAFTVPLLVLIVGLIIEGQFNLKPQLGFITRPLARKMASVSFYGILTSFSGKIAVSIDSIMINAIIGISQTGIYAITYYFGSIILIPSRSITKISGVVIADAWKDNDLKTIAKIYYKSSLNQFIFAILLFIGIWANIHNIFGILPPEYLPGKWVIFFIGLGCVIQMLGGMNSNIIATSKHYRMLTWFIMFHVLVIIISNLIFIPIYGIVGAALASAIAHSIFNMVKFTFLRVKFGFQPYNYKFLLIIVFALLAYGAGYLLPALNSLVWDIIIRSALISIVFGSLILLFRISEEVNKNYRAMLKIFKR